MTTNGNNDRSPAMKVNHRARASHGEGRVGGPCNTIKRDNYWCTRPAVVVIDGRGYCKRHAEQHATVQS